MAIKCFFFFFCDVFRAYNFAAFLTRLQYNTCHVNFHSALSLTLFCHYNFGKMRNILYVCIHYRHIECIIRVNVDKKWARKSSERTNEPRVPTWYFHYTSVPTNNWLLYFYGLENAWIKIIDDPFRVANPRKHSFLRHIVSQRCVWRKQSESVYVMKRARFLCAFNSAIYVGILILLPYFFLSLSHPFLLMPGTLDKRGDRVTFLTLNCTCVIQWQQNLSAWCSLNWRCWLAPSLTIQTTPPQAISRWRLQIKEIDAFSNDVFFYCFIFSPAFFNFSICLFFYSYMFYACVSVVVFAFPIFFSFHPLFHLLFNIWLLCMIQIFRSYV